MINERLREVRKKYGLTQQLVADFLGLDRTTYTYYEMGTICPSVATFIKLSEMYKVSIAYLVCEKDDPTPLENKELSEVAEDYDFAKTIDRKEKELVIFFRALDEKSQKRLLKRLNPNNKRNSTKE